MAIFTHTILLLCVALLCFVALVFLFKPDTLGVPPPVGKIITFTGGQSKKYCGVTGTKEIQCNLPRPTDAAKFTVEDLGDGTHALKSLKTNQFCHDQGDKIVCHSDVVNRHEKFHWIDMDKSFALTGPKSGTKRHYCADEVQRIRCNRPKPGPWEIFTIRSSSTLPPPAQQKLRESNPATVYHPDQLGSDPSYAEEMQTGALKAEEPASQNLLQLVWEFIASLWGS
jgi:hypothetical protein